MFTKKTKNDPNYYQKNTLYYQNPISCLFTNSPILLLPEPADPQMSAAPAERDLFPIARIRRRNRIPKDQVDGDPKTGAPALGWFMDISLNLLKGL